MNIMRYNKNDKVVYFHFPLFVYYYYFFQDIQGNEWSREGKVKAYFGDWS